MKINLQLIIVSLILLISGGLLVGPLLLKDDSGHEQNMQTILVYPKKNPLPEFTLQSTSGQPLTPAQMRGKWTLMFTGYTSCPDVCPTTLDDMSKVYQLLPEQIQQQMQFTFVSVDPERDDIDTLKNYLSYFSDQFVGATGDQASIDSLVYALGGVYRLNKEEGEFYSVDHSARLFLVDAKARRYGLINHEVLQQKQFALLARELTQVVSEFN